MNDSLEEIRKLLREVFTTPAAVETWLDTPDRRFAGRTPREELSTPGGAARVRALVLAAIHGIPP